MQLHLRIEQPTRIDLAVLHALRRQFPHLSRATLKPWFHGGKVFLGRTPLPASRVLEPGDYELSIPDPDSGLAPPEAATSRQGCFLPVVYEDRDLFVLNKTTGVPSVPHTNEESETAVGAALAHDPSIRSVGRGGFEPSVLHRLDTGTSGLLVFARTQEAFDHLLRCWKSGEVRKEYRALARSCPEKARRAAAGPAAEPLVLPLREPRLIAYPLAHDPKAKKRMIAVTDEKKSDLPLLPTRTRVLGSRQIAPDYFDLHIEIETGVMHQIRCHLAACGWPILGDPVYGGAPSRRLWLHAWKLTLPLPDGRVLTLEAELPPGWPA